MVCLLRVDGRLIHGMVAVTWVGELKPDVLVVANDEAANDSFHTMTLKLAKPPNVDLYVWTLDKAIDRINGPKYEGKRIFVTVGTIKDAEYLVDRCESIKNVNIGPEVDPVAGRVTEGKTEVGGVYISSEQFSALKRMHDKGVEVYARITPQVARAEYAEIAKKFE